MNESTPAAESAEQHAAWSEGGMNMAEAAGFLGVSQRTIYNLVEDGKLAKSKVRGRAVVSRRDCREILVLGSRAA